MNRRTAGNFYFLQIPVIMSNSGSSFANGYDLLQQPNSGSCAVCMEVYGQLESTTNCPWDDDTSRACECGAGVHLSL